MPRGDVRVQRVAHHKIDPDILLKFVWEGGPYIDVSVAGRTAQDVINVWDYREGKARIPFTQKALSQAAKDWIGEYPRESLIHDVTQNWR